MSYLWQEESSGRPLVCFLYPNISLSLLIIEFTFKRSLLFDVLSVGIEQPAYIFKAAREGRKHYVVRDMIFF